MIFLSKINKTNKKENGGEYNGKIKQYAQSGIKIHFKFR
jgi:hypothetical protein